MSDSLRLVASIDEQELAQLYAQWGAAPRRHVELAVDHPFLSGDHQMLVSDGRRAEICYIMHRGSPAQGVLLHIKTFYPAGAFRLPTGGIHQGEAVLATLAREILEETGLQVGTTPETVRVERYLGALSYRFHHRSRNAGYDYATYHFLVQMPAGAQLNPQDPRESIGGWQWTPPAGLWQVADGLQSVGAVAPDWADWGRYRSLSHRFVAERLVEAGWDGMTG